jgi:LacI family transcriptional regulator
LAKTLHDVAAKAGVSVSTASRVLNGKSRKYRISPATAELVERIAAELEYRPNHVARGLRLNRTDSIGLVAPDISNPFFAGIIKRVQNVANEMGYSLLVCDSDERLESEIEHVNLMFRNRVDGLIVMAVGNSSEHFVEWLETGRPLVFIDRCFDELPADSISVDNYSGARQGVEHLIAAGHRRIAFIQGLADTFTNRARLAGYRDALAEAGIPVPEELIVGGDYREERGYMETKLLMSLAHPPTAIFATSDLITLGVFRAVYEEDLSIPEDVSLVMFDDFEFAPYMRCPPTAIRQPKKLMGELAVKMLDSAIHGRSDQEKRVRLKTKLIERDSVGPPKNAWP